MKQFILLVKKERDHKSGARLKNTESELRIHSLAANQKKGKESKAS